MEKTIVVSKEILANPRQVWDLITDLANMGRWSPENDGGKWLTKDGEPKLGARFIGNNSWEGNKWIAPVKITEFNEPKRFAFKMRFPFIGGSDWSFDIEPTSEGCKVTQTWVDRRKKALVVIGGKVSGVADRAPHTRMSMETTLEKLADEVNQ
ncbi:MAG: hypothetical protein CL431_10215 [Acidimicrobiaceae bacterium]|jgi:uncharacterized protein YndB with AHSA1/START domain|nr:hypothetical protein [Acidimicrobiaceae bacterium]|tara:strand:- start:26601 stop:27059 length:459 start_codon:yes stop_codon:yes gene_type:complete